MGVCINRYVCQHEKTLPMEEESDQNKKQLPEPNTPKFIQNSRQAPMINPHVNISGEASSNYDKLCLSLLCGLPNEQEFALNICTILSNEGSYMLQLEQAPQLVDLLTAQAGVWRLDDQSQRMLFLESWKGLKGRNMYQFWRSALDLKNNSLLQLLGLELGEYEDVGKFFNLDNEMGLWNLEGQRVLRIALILHNLSFEKNNIPILIASKTFLRFLLLAINCSWLNLKQTAYDTLSNVAHMIKLSMERDVGSRLLFQAVMEGIQSSDRYMAIRSMDILSQLCNCDLNEDIIPLRMDVEIYQQMVSYLTAHDIMLLFYTLEALYALSDLGHYPCDRIACVHGSIGSLVNLLTLDPSQYGPSAQIRMKIVETLVPVESSKEQEPVTELAPPIEPPTSTPSSTPSSTPTDSETFASNWLKSAYEVSSGNQVSRNDVYADYVSFCSKSGRKGVLNASVFAGCVKNSFPQCGLKKIISDSGVVTFHHDGLKRKNVTSFPSPLPLQKNPVPPASVACTKATPKPLQSPILKAQLSTPATLSATPLLKTYAQASTKVTPVSRASPAASSTLIKSLLANKVQQRNNQQNVSKMVIYSPGKVVGSPTTIVRCIRPAALPQVNHSMRQALQAARIVPNKGCILTAPNSGVIKANPMWSPKVQLPASQTPLQINGIQNDVKVEVHSEEAKNMGIVTTSPAKPTNFPILLESRFVNDTKDSPKNVIKSTNNKIVHKDPGILLSSIRDNALTSNEMPTTTGSYFIVRSPTISFSPNKESQRGVTLVNGSDNFSLTAPSVIQPKVISSPSSILKSVLNELDTPKFTRTQQIQRESICKKAPLLNGLLDKGKLPLLEEFQSKILLQNGVSSAFESETKSSNIHHPLSVHSSAVNSVAPVSLNSLNREVFSSSSNSVFTLSSNSVNHSILTVSSANSISPFSTVIPSPINVSVPVSLNSVVMPASSLNSVILPSASTGGPCQNSTTSPLTISPAPVLVPSIMPATSFHSNGTDLMQICTGQTTFSGTVEMQPDQKGVVRLHIESPENSNQGSDLSSISDIARTLECASQAISRTNAECNTQVPCSSTCVPPQTVAVINANTQISRAGQQIIVVTPVLNQPQLQSPNIKLCILQSVPKTDESIDLITIPQVNFNQFRKITPETTFSALKRPSSDIPPVVPINSKKLRIDSKSSLLEASLLVPPTNASIDKKSHEPHLIKSSPVDDPSSKLEVPIPVQNSELSNELETFSGLLPASDNPSLMTSSQATPKSASSKLEFLCEWKDCNLKFSNAGLVFLHASEVHVSSENMICQWEGCDSMKRKRFSLLTHLQDWHCNERVLHTQAVRRLQLSQQGKTSVPPPQKPPLHPGYAPNAAMLAIKRHALQYINPKELSEEKESSLTKSIRLTSALILRNLVTHSSIARTYVRRFEPELSYLAMSPVESARTLAQCLSELSRTHD